MKVPLSWLKDYVDVDLAPRDLAHRITLAGVEAEGVTIIGESWENVVVGLVREVNPHPNADRLRLATVDTSGQVETVVCGAPNVAAGQKIAFARVGARLRDGHTGQPTTLKPAKIRGVESRGMVCSERELGLSDEHEGILVLPADAPVGAPFAQYYGDAIIDFAPTTNRPDCLSMLGIAREAAAITGRAVREPSLDYPEAGEPAAQKATVEIEDPSLCPRYIAGIVTGVTIGPSPRWMQDRLKAAGMRPINNVVDITNYVMLEYGQPLHAFDYDLLSEHRIVVRLARAGERMPFIDGQERPLKPDMLAIADARGPAALAGVMGGAHTEVGEKTRNILLESACFNNVVIRRTSRDLALRSEASSRFEKGLSPELPLHAARRAMQLLVRLAGGTACRGFLDVYPGRATRQPVPLTEERTEKVLGMTIPVSEMRQILGSLGFQAVDGGAGTLAVTAPYWRMDIGIEEDLIEELARIKGYASIPTSARVGRLPPYEPQPMLALKDRVRDTLAAAGLDEIVNYSLTNAETRAKSLAAGPDPLRPLHPISSDLEEMRLSLRGGLLRNLATNQRIQDGGVHVFEIGRVYIPRENDLPDEREMLVVALSGPRRDSFWRSGEGDASRPSDQLLDFFDAKGILEGLLWNLGLRADYSPAQDSLLQAGRAAQVSIGGGAVGLVGELHQKVLAAFDCLPRPVAYVEIDLHRLLPFVPERSHMYHPISRFPGVVRDLALVLDADIAAVRVLEIIMATPLVQRAELFDVYWGDQVSPGKKSLAYHIVYQSPERTLTSEEARQQQERLLDRLGRELGATLRA